MAVKREQVVQTAEKYVSRGKIEPAIKEYRKLLADNPNDIATLNRVGDLYARLQRNEEAIDFFVQIAEQYTAEGFFPKATAIYKKIIKLDPTRLDIYEKLAELYGRQGLVTEARSQYQVLADYYQKHENAASAIGIYQKLAQLEPENPTYHVKLAEVYQAQQLIEKALGEYRTIAEMMIAAGHAQEAAQVYERALDLESGNLGFITDAVLALRQAGMVAAAARLLSVAVERNPQAAGVARLVGMPEGHPGAAVVEETFPASQPAPAAARPAPPPAPPPAATPVPPVFGDGDEITLELPEEFALEPRAPEAAAEAGTQATAETSETTEFELDLDEVFVLDLEDDRVPTSQVAPPPDMVDELPRRPSWSHAAAAEPVEPAPPPPGPLAAAPPSAPVSQAPPGAPGAPAESLGGLTADEAAALEESLLDFDLGAFEELPPLDVPPPPPAAAGPRGALRVDEELGSVAEFELELDELPEFELTLAGEEEALFRDSVLAEEAAPVEEALDAVPLTEPAAAEPLPAAPPPLFAVEPEEPLGVEAALPPPPQPAAAPAAARPREREDELVAEAEVLARYGLEEKALEKLREALRMNPRNLEAHAVLVQVHLDQGRHAKAVEMANAMAKATAKAASSEPWQRVKKRLVAAGFQLDGDRVAAPPRERPAAARDRGLERLLEGLLEPAAGKAKGAKGKAASAPGEKAMPAAADLKATEPAGKPGGKKRTGAVPVVDALAAADLLVGKLPAAGKVAPATPKAATPAASEAPPVQPLPGAVPPAPVPPPRKPATGRTGKIDLRQMGREIAAEEFGEIVDMLDAGEVPGAPPAPARRLPDAILDDTGGMSWLDEADARRASGAAGAAGAAGGEGLFAAEEEFFDLAAELEQELSREGVLGRGELLMQPREQSLEEIVEGFKKGVAENLSATDFETHFNLGIAYREMGLLDEAIGEFQLAAKSPVHLVSCCSMLGLCFLDKGLPELAIKWYRRGLAAPGLNEEDQLGLLYDLGNVQMSLGESPDAYRTFVELYGINTNYRDVVAKLEELGPR